jgi:hypothetical protein
VQYIYGQGGRSFWIHNTGPVGCLPYILDRFLVAGAQLDEYGCASLFNEVAQYFNRRLKEAVVQLRKELPEAVITYVDVYAVKYTLITQAKKYGTFLLPFIKIILFFFKNIFYLLLFLFFCCECEGFQHPLVACCGHGGKYNFNRYVKCGAKKTINGKEILMANSCKDPSVRVNWDGVHFTEAANKWIFEQIADGSFSDPPISLQIACQRI